MGQGTNRASQSEPEPSAPQPSTQRAPQGVCQDVLGRQLCGAEGMVGSGPVSWGLRAQWALSRASSAHLLLDRGFARPELGQALGGVTLPSVTRLSGLALGRFRDVGPTYDVMGALGCR